MPQIPLANSRGAGTRMLGNFLGVVSSAVLFPILFIFNVSQLFSLVLVPFSGRAFRAYNRFLADTWWGWCVTLAQLYYGTRIVVTGDPIPPLENAIVVPNHQEMPDTTFLMFLAKSKGRLGDLKWFAKDVVKYVPGMGWGMRLIGCVFLKRDWTRDRTSVERAFSNLTRTKMPFWLVIFAEGTRITQAKADSNRKFFEEKHVAPFEHVLRPRNKGFVASVQGLRDSHLAAVYDVTIGYPDGVPTLFQYMNGGVRVAHLHVRRYPLVDMPETDDELAEWLMDRFREKDQLLAGFYEKGQF